jgi:hypothetical protein
MNWSFWGTERHILTNITKSLNERSLDYISSKQCHASTIPPLSQVEVLQQKSILLNHKKYVSQPARNYNRKVTFSSRKKAELRRTAATKIHKPTWKPWSDFRPNKDGQEHFNGNYRGEATARKVIVRKEHGATARAERSAKGHHRCISSSNNRPSIM